MKNAANYELFSVNCKILFWDLSFYFCTFFLVFGRKNILLHWNSAKFLIRKSDLFSFLSIIIIFYYIYIFSFFYLIPCHDVLCGPRIRNYCESESIGVDGYVTVRLFTTERECINKSSSSLLRAYAFD